MAAARISASGAPTNVAFPTSPIHLLAAFNNDRFLHKYLNTKEFQTQLLHHFSKSDNKSNHHHQQRSLYQRVTKRHKKRCHYRPVWAEALFLSVHFALLLFLFFFSSYDILLPFCLFYLNRHLPLLDPGTHSLPACLSSNRVLSCSIALDIHLFLLILRPLS